jgi:hypothetical protein
VRIKRGRVHLISIVADEGSAVPDVITTSVEVPASPQSSHSGAGTTAEIEYLGRLGKVDAQRREDGELNGEAYNVGAGREYTIETLAKSLCNLTGLNPAFHYSGANRPGDPEKLVVDITRLESIGYTPRFEFEEGLTAVVQWFEDLTGETWK